MTAYPHAGSLSTGFYVGKWSDQRPTSYRETIAKLYPNGSMPLTGLISRNPKEKVTDPTFNWWEQDFASRQVTVTGVYTNVACTTAYTSGGAVGSSLYVAFTDDNDGSYSKQFRAGQMVILLNSADYNVQKRAYVTAVVKSSATTAYCVARLIQADNSSGNTLSTANTMLIIGNTNPELGERPTEITYRPVKRTNYTQIFRNSLSISRTLQKTKLRTGSEYEHAKAEALEQHGLDMESALLWGYPYETTGSNGKPMRTTGGLFYWASTYAPSSHIDDYVLNTDYAGKDWTDAKGGLKWLNERLEILFRYGRSEKMAVCGSGALLALNELAMTTGQITLAPKDIAFGTSVIRWITPVGNIYLKTHPLMSYEATFRNTMLILEPENIKIRYIDDTFFKSDKTERESDSDGKDGKEEEFLTELGFEFKSAKTFGILYGVGSNNVLTGD